MDSFLETLTKYIEPTMVIVILVVLLFINTWIFRRMKHVKSTANVVKRSISFSLIFIAVLVFILSLPIDKSLKGQILSFLGIIISAGIALSSTTLLGNLMAGLMNHSMNRFRNGDLIQVADLHGRVINKSIFHTEIQLEDSNFVTIPNLYIATHPVKLTRKSNTVISTTVSLGYDVSRVKIEQALVDAAKQTGLKDPYVYILSLEDFSVVYKIHGFLEDSSKYFSTSSLLNAKVMDLLHEKKIEIVSPTFMNQRKVDETAFIPKQIVEPEKEKTTATPEEMVFDEAIEAEKIENKKDYLKKLREKKGKLKEALKEQVASSDKEKIKKDIERLEGLEKRIEESIKENQKKEE